MVQRALGFVADAGIYRSGASGAKIVDAKTQLWTDRYAPQTLKEICGNKTQVERLQNWLNSWFALPSSFVPPS